MQNISKIYNRICIDWKSGTTASTTISFLKDGFVATGGARSVGGGQCWRPKVHGSSNIYCSEKGNEKRNNDSDNFLRVLSKISTRK